MEKLACLGSHARDRHLVPGQSRQATLSPCRAILCRRGAVVFQVPVWPFRAAPCYRKLVYALNEAASWHTAGALSTPRSGGLPNRLLGALKGWGV